MTTLAYFSRAGMNVVAGQPQRLAVGYTARLADRIATTLGLPAQAIVPQQPYPDDYQATIDRTRREYEQRSWPDVLTPAPLQGDVLLLGFPIWWGDLPRPVASWLRQVYQPHMTILPFCTHAGSRFGTSLTTIRRLCPMAVVAMGLPVRGDRVDQAGCAVTHWLREADLTSGR